MKVFSLILTFLLFVTLAQAATVTIDETVVVNVTQVATTVNGTFTEIATAIAYVTEEVNSTDSNSTETASEEEDPLATEGGKVRVFLVFFFYLTVIFEHSFLRYNMFYKSMKKRIIGFKGASGKYERLPLTPEEKLARFNIRTVIIYAFSRFAIYLSVFFLAYLLIDVVLNKSVIWAGLFGGIFSIWLFIQFLGISFADFVDIDSKKTIKENSLNLFRIVEILCWLFLLTALVATALIIWGIIGTFVEFTTLRIVFSVLFFLMFFVFILLEQFALGRVAGISYIPKWKKSTSMAASKKYT